MIWKLLGLQGRLSNLFHDGWSLLGLPEFGSEGDWMCPPEQADGAN